MESHPQAPKFSDNDNPNGQVSPVPWRWVCIVLGILFIVLPLTQTVLAFKPMLDMLAFVPLSYFIQEMLPSMAMANAAILAGIGFFVGGILLIFGNRWGYVLTLSSAAFSLISMVETVVIFAIIAAQSGTGTMGMYVGEAYSILGILPLFVALLDISAFILLNFNGMRNYLKVDRRTSWITFGWGFFLFLNMNVCFLVAFLMPIG